MKQMTYWHYTYIISGRFNGEISFGWGIRTSETEFPDFAGIHEDFPDLVILSINEIDAEQAATLNKMIEKIKVKDEDNR